MASIVMNGFEVDSRLINLMLRKDWAFCRGRRQLVNTPLLPDSETWLEYFKSSETLSPHAKGIFGIDFFSIETAIKENENIRNPEISVLWGQPSKRFPPGDFDSNNGYLIGLTSEVDEGVFVDLRPDGGPIITYSNHCIGDSHIVTAFQSIDDFVQFYIEQHGP